MSKIYDINKNKPHKVSEAKRKTAEKWNRRANDAGIHKRIDTKTKDEENAIAYAIAAIAVLEQNRNDAPKPIAVGGFTWRGEISIEEFGKRKDAVIEMYIRDLREKMKRNAILITEENGSMSIARPYYSGDKNAEIR